MDDDMSDVLDTYFLELKDQIQAANDDILLFESGKGTGQIDSLFRTLHTIKGNSMMMGFERLASIAHAAESVLDKLRCDAIVPSKQLVDILLSCLDAIESLGNSIQINAEEPSGIDRIIELLGQISQGTLSPQSVASQVELSLPAKSAEKRELSILVVDDDFITRKVIAKYLESYGACDFSGDGLEAIKAFGEALEEKPYDYVFMDIMLPGMDGFEVVKQMRSLEMIFAMQALREQPSAKRRFHRHDAIIVMTSSLDDPESCFNACYRCGANTYLVKPVDKAGIDELFLGKNVG